MKVKEGFILRKVGRQHVVAAIGKRSEEFNGMIRLNEEAGCAFALLQQGIEEAELVSALVEKFGGDPAEVSADVADFVRRLKEADVLD